MFPASNFEGPFGGSVSQIVYITYGYGVTGDAVDTVTRCNMLFFNLCCVHNSD